MVSESCQALRFELCGGREHVSKQAMAVRMVRVRLQVCGAWWDAKAGPEVRGSVFAAWIHRF